MHHGEAAEDPHLGQKRYELVLGKARQLSAAGMILLNEESGSLKSTELGRIAAKYYIRSASVEIYNRKFRHGMKDADVLTMLCMSAEVSEKSVFVTHIYCTDSLTKFNCVKVKLRRSVSLRIMNVSRPVKYR